MVQKPKTVLGLFLTYQWWFWKREAKTGNSLVPDSRDHHKTTPLQTGSVEARADGEKEKMREKDSSVLLWLPPCGHKNCLHPMIQIPRRAQVKITWVGAYSMRLRGGKDPQEGNSQCWKCWETLLGYRVTNFLWREWGPYLAVLRVHIWWQGPNLVWPWARQVTHLLYYLCPKSKNFNPGETSWVRTVSEWGKPGSHPQYCEVLEHWARITPGHYQVQPLNWAVAKQK